MDFASRSTCSINRRSGGSIDLNACELFANAATARNDRGVFATGFTAGTLATDFTAGNSVGVDLTTGTALTAGASTKVLLVRPSV